jgi:DHA1 family multidrug resistance protein-like MFS transporter
MFNGMGIQWASTLLGCVALVLVPVPIWFYLKGEKIRQKSKFAPTHLAPKDESTTDEEKNQ